MTYKQTNVELTHQPISNDKQIVQIINKYVHEINGQTLEV